MASREHQRARGSARLLGRVLDVITSGTRTARRHWSLYLYEALGLAWILLVAGTVVSLLYASSSPVSSLVESHILRRMLVGLAMAGALIGLIYSPWGMRSGAHINPAITLAFLRLGKIAPWDAIFYILAQFAGAVLGVALFSAAVGPWASDPGVNHIVTVPGRGGPIAAFFTEVAITFAMMYLVLVSINSPRLAHYTGFFAAILLAVLVLTVAPISGVSLNPARSFGSAAVAFFWSYIWLYFVAPPLGALLATMAYQWLHNGKPVICAKLYHGNPEFCIFRNCGYNQRSATGNSKSRRSHHA